MATEQNEDNRNKMDVLDKLYAAFAKGDFEALDAILAPDVELEEAAALPYGGIYKGPAGVRDLMRKLGETWVSLTPEDMMFTAGGDVASMYCTLVGTSKATGRELRMPLIETWTFKDGKPARGRVFYYDTREVRSVCGLD